MELESESRAEVVDFSRGPKRWKSIGAKFNREEFLNE